MDQPDHNTDILRYIGVTFLGAAIQWVSARMRRRRQPSQLSINAAIVQQFTARFDSLDERLDALIEMQASHGNRLAALERRRAAGAH